MDDCPDLGVDIGRPLLHQQARGALPPPRIAASSSACGTGPVTTSGLPPIPIYGARVHRNNDLGLF